MRTALAGGLAAATALGPPAAAGDMLLLQRTAPPDEAASPVLLVDRDRVVLARIRQGADPRLTVEVTLTGEPNLAVSVSCEDLASARQVLEALRPRGPSTLDVSGRCQF
jgi:hypothetical protein